jgi:hypothetical protein
MSRTIMAFAALLGLALAVSHAGDLAEIRARQKVAVDKLIGQVDKAIQDSRTLSPGDANTLLQGVLREVKDSREIPDADRTALRKRLETRLGQVSNDQRGDKVRQDQRPLSDPPARKKFEIPEQPSRGGGSASSVAKDFIGNTKGAQSTAAENNRRQQEGRLAVNRDIERVLPMDREINFPSNWKEISERRKSMVSQRLTEKEVNLLKTLNSTLSVKYDRDSFKAVINHLQDRTGLDIIIDEGSMRDVNVDYDDPVTFKVEKATVRTVLKKILGDKGLTYIIKEGGIQVMTPKKAAEYTVVRSYPIGDLITPVTANAMFPPFMQQAQKNQNAQQIINLIVFMTGQDYWQPNGPGSIAYFPATDSLLIRASAEMHYQLASPGLFGR